MSRRLDPPDKSRERRTNIVVALIGAIGVIIAAVVSALLAGHRSGNEAQPAQASVSNAVPPKPAPHAPFDGDSSSAADTTNIERNAIAVWHTLDTLPPLRRDAIARALFVGQTVTWGGVVHSIAADRHGFVIGVRRRKAYSPTFYAVLDSGQYSLLSAMRIEDSVVIRGRISHADLNKGVWLDQAVITTHSR